MGRPPVSVRRRTAGQAAVSARDTQEPEGIRDAARRTLVSRGQKPSAPTDTRPPEAATHRARGPGRGSGRPTRQGFRGSVWGRTPRLGTDAGDGGTDGGRASCR